MDVVLEGIVPVATQEEQKTRSSAAAYYWRFAESPKRIEAAERVEPVLQELLRKAAHRLLLLCLLLPRLLPCGCRFRRRAAAILRRPRRRQPDRRRKDAARAAVSCPAAAPAAHKAR